jgi:hypothetical protein
MVTNKKNKFSKQRIRYYAAMAFLTAIAIIASSIWTYVNRDLLNGPDVQWNLKTIHDIKIAMKALEYLVLPALSVMFLLISKFLWQLSNNIDNRIIQANQNEKSA